MKNNYSVYAQTFGASDKVTYWLEHNLVNYLKDNEENQGEIEHIIDFLVSDEAPIKMEQMSYPDAKKATNKWVQKLQKQASKITELPEDTEVVLDFKDGFKIVQLVGKNAYEREGKLMSHCVASYYGRDTKVYSLRDEQNNPHCTIEQDQQIKGKGNGSINPKYIGYVVKFLEWSGMDVRDSEMLNLGYVNVEKHKKYIQTDGLFKKKYWFKEQPLLKKDGTEFASLDLLDSVTLIDDRTLKVNFRLESFIKLSIDFLFSQNKSSKKVSSDYSSKLAASGDSSKLAASGYYSQLAASGDSSQLAASGYSSKLAASGYSSKLAASGDSSKLAASGYSSKLAASGYYSKLAASGDSSKLEVNGADSVGAAIGKNSMIKASLGSWITLAEYDFDYKPICVKSAQIDGKKLKPGVFYKLQNKKFVEVTND